MKKEIITFLAFATLLVLQTFNVPYSGVILGLSILPITIMLILAELKKRDCRNHILISLSSIFNKVILYTAIIFIALDYPEQTTIVGFGTILSIVNMLLSYLYWSDKKQFWNLFVYFKVAIILYFVYFLS